MQTHQLVGVVMKSSNVHQNTAISAAMQDAVADLIHKRVQETVCSDRERSERSRKTDHHHGENA